MRVYPETTSSDFYASFVVYQPKTATDCYVIREAGKKLRLVSPNAHYLIVFLATRRHAVIRHIWKLRQFVLNRPFKLSDLWLQFDNLLIYAADSPFQGRAIFSL